MREITVSLKTPRTELDFIKITYQDADYFYSGGYLIIRKTGSDEIFNLQNVVDVEFKTV